MRHDKIRFVQSAPTFTILKDLGLPEVAFIGRSNVGKSTLIGRVIGRPKLVRTSRTPGRTQLLNLFDYGGRLAVVDMPGYGYAKLSKKQRAEINEMVQGYLRGRQQLRGVIQVVDARRDPVSEYDRFVAAWVLEQGRALLVALTKIDLVPKNRRAQRARVIEKQLGAESVILCSGKTGDGCGEIRKRIWEIAE